MVHFLKNVFIWQNQELAILFRFLSISFLFVAHVTVCQLQTDLQDYSLSISEYQTIISHKDMWSCLLTIEFSTGAYINV